MEVEEVEEFLKSYSSVLLSEHKQRIFHMYKYIKEFSTTEKITSRYGTHFALCAWAYDNSSSGPDTCNCCSIENYKTELENLIKWYKCNVKGTNSIGNT